MPTVSRPANRFAANVLPIIREIQASGVSSLRGIAKALTARGIKTAMERGAGYGHSGTERDMNDDFGFSLPSKRENKALCWILFAFFLGVPGVIFALRLMYEAGQGEMVILLLTLAVIFGGLWLGRACYQAGQKAPERAASDAAFWKAFRGE